MKTDSDHEVCGFVVEGILRAEFLLKRPPCRRRPHGLSARP